MVVVHDEVAEMVRLEAHWASKWQRDREAGRDIYDFGMQCMAWWEHECRLEADRLRHVLAHPID